MICLGDFGILSPLGLQKRNRQFETFVQQISFDGERYQVSLPEECYSESNYHTVIQLFTFYDHVNQPQIEQVINSENYNSFNHLSHVTALVLKFAHLLLQKIGQTSELINSNTLDDARLYWLMESQ